MSTQQIYVSSLIMKKKNPPKYHHLVPRCYMKHFATQVKKKEYFADYLYCPDVNLDLSKIITKINIKNFGGINHYYTLNAKESINKLIIEDTFCKIESKYIPIYNKLINPSVSELTLSEKRDLLTFIVSLKVRGKRYHNMLNSIFDRTIDFAYQVCEQKGVEKAIYFGDNSNQKISFEEKTISEAKKDSNESNRLITITSIWEHIPKIVNLLMSHSLCVWKNNSELGYISNDNPVNTTNGSLYDINNTWDLVIDRKHKISFIPPTLIDNYNPQYILRSPIVKISSLIDNISKIENRIDFLFGWKDEISKSVEMSFKIKENPIFLAQLLNNPLDLTE